MRATTTHAQATAFNTVGSGASVTCTLTNNPALGDAVWVVAYGQAATVPTLTSILDSNSNAYTKTPNSPEGADIAATGAVWIAYLLSAPANASKTIVVTFSTSLSNPACFVDDFTVTGGTYSFSNDSKNAQTSIPSPVTSPTLAPGGSADLFYSTCAIDNSNITGVGGGWVENTHGADTSNGEDAAYQIGVSSTTTVNFNWATGNNTTDCMEGSLNFTASGGGSPSQKKVGPQKAVGPVTQQ